MSLERFRRAQAPIWEQALAELRAGAKRGHWMWFVFPQLAGLGRSETARFYGLDGLAEARAYLADPVLRARLVEACAAVVGAPGTAEAILGPVDALKLRSSATLFEAAAEDPAPFAAVLDRFHGGERDPETLRRLSALC